MRAALQNAVEHDGSGGLGEGGELTEGVLGILLGALRMHAHEHHVLEPQLPVLDLGDVLELGGQPGHAAQRRALLTIPLVAVRVRAADGGFVLKRLRGTEHAHPRTRLCTLEHSIHRVRQHFVRALGCRRIRHLFLSRCFVAAFSCGTRSVRNSSLPPRGGPPLLSRAMESDHYFSASPASAENLRRIRVTLAGRSVEVTTAGGVFSPDHVDSGTGVLFANTPPPPSSGNLLDLGSGWGPIALTLALESPHATVWAVDVNERALDLVRRNVDALGLDNVNAVLPDDVPEDVVFRSIRSNPPIRVGKNELHGLLERWIPRLDERADAWLVVQRNLGSDSLQRWLAATFEHGYSVHRAATARGFRVLRVRRHGSPPTAPIDLPSLDLPMDDRL